MKSKIITVGGTDVAEVRIGGFEPFGRRTRQPRHSVAGCISDRMDRPSMR